MTLSLERWDIPQVKMRDKKLTAEEEDIRAKIDNPDIPNGIAGSSIMLYKMYCSLLEQIVRLDAEIEGLKK